MQDKIKNRIDLLQKRIDNARLEIEKLRSECIHPKECLTKTYGADTGNWCPQDDIYWKDYICSNCGKRWREYSRV